MGSPRHISRTLRWAGSGRARTFAAVVFGRPQQRRSFAGVHRELREGGAVLPVPVAARVRVRPLAAFCRDETSSFGVLSFIDG